MKGTVRKRKTIGISIILLSMCFYMNTFGKKPVDFVSIFSPDSAIQATVYTDEKANLVYTHSYMKDVVIRPSRLGIMADGVDLGKQAVIENACEFMYNRPNRGRAVKEKLHQDANHCIIQVKTGANSKYWSLECELSDQGFAFRYKIPGYGKSVIGNEFSSFSLPKESVIWFFERDNDWKLKSYAGEWTKSALSEMPGISKTGPVQGTPIIINLSDEKYILISESACFDYSGMRLEAIAGGIFTVNLADEDGFFLDGDILTPWRVVMCASSLDQLVNNTMITDLAPEPDTNLYKDISYIKPGKSVWRWWSHGTGTPEEEKQYIDHAAKLNFSYTTIDEGWEKWSRPWEAITALAAYAEAKQVGIFLWKHSKDLNYPENDYQQMRDWLDQVQEAGAVGIKVDFMNGETKSLIDFDIRLLKEAARRKLLVNFHGCQKPTGENYTFPNELTREGIRGLELNHMKEGPIPAGHNAALPFTRFVVGNGDYTPLSFNSPGNTTWTHQLATLICFTSSLQVIAEDPEFLLTDKRVSPVLDIIKSVPTTWEKTIVLPGSKIGEVAAMARKAGNKWYIGILNTQKREFGVDFSFLEKDGIYNAKIVEDISDKNKEDNMFIINKARVNVFSRMDFFLNENGGLVIELDQIVNR